MKSSPWNWLEVWKHQQGSRSPQAEPGAGGGGIPVNSFCLVSQFLIRTEQAKRRVGFDMTGQISNFVFIGCVTWVKLLNFSEPSPPPPVNGAHYVLSLMIMASTVP